MESGHPLCPSPSDTPHLLSPICISHLGLVPLGKFPAPVLLSLQSWTICFCQLLRGPALLPAAARDKGQHVLLPPKPSPFDSPKADRGGDFVPREGWCHPQHGDTEHLCGYEQLSHTALSFSLEKKRNLTHITRFYFQVIFGPCTTVSFWGAPVF